MSSILGEWKLEARDIEVWHKDVPTWFIEAFTEFNHRWRQLEGPLSLEEREQREADRSYILARAYVKMGIAPP